MSRQLLLGTVTYPWPNDGDLDWGQELFDWAQAVSTRINDLEAGFLNIEDNSVGEAKLKITNTPTIGQYLTFAGSDNFVWVDAPSGGGGSATIADGSIGEDKLNITNTGTAGQVLSLGPSNNFTWVAASEAGVEDLSGVKGGSGITVTHTQSNAVATVNLNESIQNQLVPTGGTTGQVLTKQSNTANDVHWTTVTSGGGTYRAGIGLTLNTANNTFSIGTDQIINSMMQDDSIEQSNIWATANATAGQILSAHTDGTRFTWVTPQTYSAGSGLVTDTSGTNTTFRISGLNRTHLLATNTATVGQYLTATTNNRFTWVNAPSGGGSIADDSVTPAQIKTGATPKALDVPVVNTTDGFAWIPASSFSGFIQAGSLQYNTLVDATHYVDNAGSIDPREGDYNMALVFKRQMGVGPHNEAWVPTSLDEIFQLNHVQIGADDNPNKQENYGLEFKAESIRKQDIRQVDNLDNLIGATFLALPGGGGLVNGNIYRSRLTQGWESGNVSIYPVTAGSIQITIPAKRNAETRSITHILVKAGRVSGIANNASRTDVINAIENNDNVFQEVLVPLSSSYGFAETQGRRNRYQHYDVQTAGNAFIGIRVSKLIASPSMRVEAVVNNGGNNPLNGNDFLAFYAIRGIGG